MYIYSGGSWKCKYLIISWNNNPYKENWKNAVYNSANIYVLPEGILNTKDR